MLPAMIPESILRKLFTLCEEKEYSYSSPSITQLRQEGEGQLLSFTTDT